MSSLFRVIVVSLFLMLSNVSFAIAETDLVDYLSQKIYNDCGIGQDTHGSDINLSGTAVKLLEAQNKTYILHSNVTLENLKEVVTVIVDNEPYIFRTGTDSITISNGKEGTDILVCGNKSLDINYLTYYWNGKRIDPFVIITQINQTIENITRQVEKLEYNYYNTNVSGQSNLAIGQGSSAESEVITLFNIPVTTHEISISLFSSLFGGLFGSVSVYLILVRRNRKSKGK